MNIIGVTSLIKNYHHFDQDFWLAYKALEKLLSKEEFDDIKTTLLKTKRVPETVLSTIDTVLYETEKQLIKAEWEEAREQARNLGIQIHDRIHNLFCADLKTLKKDFGIPTDSISVPKSELFLNSESGLFPEMRIEYKINDTYTLVGIPDLIIKEGNCISIIDWKSNDQIRFKGQFQLGTKQTKKLKYPLVKLEDCDGVRYQLQLSLYAYMIEQLNPDFKIKDLKIVQIKDFKKYKEFPVQYLKKEVANFIKWHVKQDILSKELAKCNLMEY